MSPATRTEPRPIPGDATLVWLASERAAPLFRTLDRSRAFGPLVVLLAVLPPLLAIFGDRVTVEDASWGLRALDLAGSEMPPEVAPAVEAVVPVERVRTAALGLSAAAMRLANPASAAGGSLASLLGGGALLGLLWPLAKTLSGRRFAFWVVLIAAFHPALGGLLRFPAPVTFGLAAAAAAFWASLSLDGRPLRSVSAWFATAATVVAGLLLIGIPALAVPAVIVVDAFLALLLPAPTIGGRPATLRPAARSTIAPGAILLRRVAAAVAGTLAWIGIERLLPDLAATAGRDVASGLVTSDRSIAEPAIAGPLWGLAAIGVGRLFRVVHRRATARSPRPVPRMILVWLIAAVATLLAVGMPADGEFDPAGRYAAALAGLCLLFAAAYAIEEAARRSVSGAWVLLAVALPLAVRLGTFMASVQADGPGSWLMLAAVAIVLMWAVTKVLPAVLPMSGLRRGVLMAAILLVVALDAADGLFLLLNGHGQGGNAFSRLTAQLRAAGPADAVILLADSPSPDLAFALRASYPRAVFEVSPSWDEAAAELARRFGQTKPRQIVAAWGAKRAAGAATSEYLRLVGEPMLFDGREILLYAGPDDP